MARRLSRLSLALALLLVACTSAPPRDRTLEVAVEGVAARALVRAGREVETAACGVRFETVTGRMEGAEWVIHKPLRDRWNGELVAVARGYIAAAEPPVDPAALLAAPAFAPMRDGALCRGFAVAASGFRANGFAVAEGTVDTLLLSPLFAALHGAPQRTYATGLSLGGAVALALAERFPDVYHGALPICGFVGGSLAQINYLGNVELLFRLLYPEALPGGLLEPIPLPYGELPLDLNELPAAAALEDPTPAEVEALEAALRTLLTPVAQPATVVERVIAAVAADPAGLEILKTVEVEYRGLAGTFALPLLQFVPADALPAELPPEVRELAERATAVVALLRPLFYTTVGKADLFRRAGTERVFDNHRLLGFDIRFRSPRLPDLDARAKAVPYRMDAAAGDYFRQHYQPTGELRIPVRTLHTAVDAAVPAWHEEVYGGLVFLAGASEHLTRVVVDERLFHCNVTAEMVLDELDALVATVRGD